MPQDNPENDKTRTFVTLAKGTTVGHYKIIAKIGAGGMGEVYLAEDTQLKRKVALKFLPSHLCQDEDCRSRFKREAQASAKLDHPNIVTVYEVSEYQGRPYFAMQHIEGQSLREYAKAKQLEIERIIELAIQICDGLGAAHEKKVIHRDIKPSNIVIDAYGRPKILDFGLAAIQGGEQLTKTGSTLGTVRYMSPEQVQGKEVDHRSDLFSLGVVLYEMITGHSPFARDNDIATSRAILSAIPEPLAKYRSNVSDELQHIVTKSLEKDSSVRYQTAAGILSDLKRLIRTTESVATISGLQPSKRFIPVRTTVFTFLAALIVVAGYFLIDKTQIGQKLGIIEPAEARWGNSIAVLPFRDFSPNKDQEYFCDGMTDEIIGRLSAIRQLKVTSMQSMLRFKGSNLDLKEIGKKLGVDHILEGNIQRDGDNIRMRVQLIRVENDAHIWSDRYDREVTSIFDIQDDISRAIVGAMRIELFDKDTTIITRRYTQNIEAYNFYMRGRHLWSKRTERDIRKAIEYFEKAIKLDPNYALAYSGLADSWGLLPGYLDVPGSVAPTEALAKAREAAEMAIGLDENIAEAHASLAGIISDESDLKGAEKEYLRAIELNPGYFWAHYWYSRLLGDMAKYSEQIREENIAFELNPMSIPLISSRAWRKSQSFEWQAAEELYQRLIEIEPNRWQSYIEYAYLLAKSMGRNEDAIRQCSLAVQIDKKAYKDMAYIYEWIGDFEKALWASNMYIETTIDKYDAYDTRGYIFSLRGMLDSAEVCLKKALELKPDFTTSLWNLGNVYMFKQEYAKAESLYQVMASHPDKYTRGGGRLSLTHIPIHQGKLKKALRMLDELKDEAIADSLLDWHQAIGTLKRALIYQQYFDDQESAISEFEKVMKTLKNIEPNSWMVAGSRGGIAYSYAAKGNLDKADQLLQELANDIDKYGPRALFYYTAWGGMLEMKKNNADIAATPLEKTAKAIPIYYYRNLMARCYLSAGRYDDAISAFEKIINRYEGNRAFWPTYSVMTHFYLGQAYDEAGRYDAAIEQYETFLDIWRNADPEIKYLDDARERLARLKSKS